MANKKIAGLILTSGMLLALVSLSYSSVPLWSRVIVSWPNVAKAAAKDIVDKYGPPDDVTSDQLFWSNQGPFVSIVVHGMEVEHNFPEPHQDILEMAIAYHVPPTRYNKLAEFDGSIVALRTKGLLVASCLNEPLIILTLNLANDVIIGKKTPAQARTAFAEIDQGLMKGEKNPYTDSLQFKVLPIDQTRDPDKAIALKKPKEIKKPTEKKKSEEMKKK